MAFVKDPLNATEPREIIEYSQDLEDRIGNEFAATKIDWGTDTAGVWVKYADGTMIYRGSFRDSQLQHTIRHGSNYRNVSTDASVTLTQPFSNVGYRVVAQMASTSVTPPDPKIIGLLTSMVMSESEIRFYTLVSESGGYDIHLHWIAIGRWK